MLVPVSLYIDRLLVLPLRTARITPRNGEAGGSAVFWEDRMGGGAATCTGLPNFENVSVATVVTGPWGKPAKPP